jgi:hypothetical protein
MWELLLAREVREERAVLEGAIAPVQRR